MWYADRSLSLAVDLRARPAWLDRVDAQLGQESRYQMAPAMYWLAAFKREIEGGRKVQSTLQYVCNICTGVDVHCTVGMKLRYAHGNGGWLYDPIS